MQYFGLDEAVCRIRNYFRLEICCGSVASFQASIVPYSGVRKACCHTSQSGIFVIGSIAMTKFEIPCFSVENLKEITVRV